MVRGNWQKRVERVDARRKEAKQRKQRTGEKRIFKSMAQDALSLLDRHMDSIRRRSSSSHAVADSAQNTARSNSSWEIHIWTDSQPTDSPPFLDILGANEGSKTSRRARSSSIEDRHALDTSNIGKNAGRKGRGRSGSFQQEGTGKNKKKVHPRSKEVDAAPVDESRAFAPLLCKSQFFSGRCLDPQKGGKRGGCRCVHYNNKQFQTLAAILVGDRNSKNEQEEALAQAAEACTEAVNHDTAESTPGSMDMVYYLTIPIPNNIGDAPDSKAPEEVEEEGTDQPTTSISDLITNKLSANSCSIASIVYMVISTPCRDVLLYDRYRDGLAISDFSSDVLGLTGLESSTGDEASSDIIQAQHLPVSVLEHILAYVEAPGVAAAAQVCVAWHREIRHASPNLWRHLLDQRGWPLPANCGSDDMDHSTTSLQDQLTSENMTNQLRDEFIRHYQVLRDVRAIQAALTGLLTKKTCEEKEMCFQSFSTRRGAPQAPNNCVAVEVWGPNQVLAAYSNDCTLRLFQAVPRGGGQNEKTCRELVCQSVDPYHRTKRKSCFMEAMGLDEDVIGCLCSVSDDTSDFKTPHILVILGRDDLLVINYRTDTAGRIAEPEEGSLQVIDIEEAVLNYVLSLDHVDHRLLRLNDFLALGGDSEEIEFIVSQSMAACGYGRFMVEVAISIPFPDEDDIHGQDDRGDMDMLLLDRKLFLFSSSVGAIVWMGDSNPPHQLLPPRLEDMTLVGLRRALPGGSTRSSCTVAAVSHAVAPFVMCCEIDHSGNIDGSHVLGSSEWTQIERAVEEGWNSRMDGQRPIVVTPSDVVVGDTLTRQLEQQNNGDREYKSIVTFYSRFPMVDGNEKHISKLEIGENCLIDRMVGFREDYILLLCRFFAETGLAAVDGGGGHWGNEMDRVSRVYALTIHIPSRRVIERLCLYEDFGWNRLTISVFGDTVACGVWIRGLVMTGSDVRSVSTKNSKSVIVVDDSMAAKASKKKGKKRQSKGKKDGFARGMSLRG